MNSLAVLRLAFISLWRNRLRSFLTALGIIISVSSVITLVGLVQGAHKSIASEIARMGTNLIFVFPGSGATDGRHLGLGTLTTMTDKDAQEIEFQCPSVSKVTPWVRTVCQAIYANQNWATPVVGCNEEFLDIRSWDLESGSNFTRNDIRNGARVCLLGKTVTDQLFGSLNPIGKTIRIKKMPFEVIGVLAEKGVSNVGENMDDRIIAPFSTVQRRMMKITHANMILVTAVSEDKLETAKDEMEELLRRRHRLTDEQPDDFAMSTQADLTAMADTTLGIIGLLLGSIASLSLIVGGINIMNIMLVAVTERTREIGIRMAVGARATDILFHFLVEAVVLSCLGGGIGIAAGLVLTQALIRGFTGWEMAVSWSAVLVSALFSAIVGVFFGIYPAWKASQLDPIEALRYE
ncbi:hypothetical protein AUK22_06270 [bacterium CG2_30_54_10]|nr:MAG: hypothetical protein AUK22_06270 [bacterium CG2_30_54_10]